MTALTLEQKIKILLEKNYIVYHLHSDRSNSILMDSTSKPEDYIKRAKELGMKAIAFSEHGSVLNWIEKKNLCDKYKIKYIHGSEFYVTTTLTEKIREAYHMGLYAKNWEGVKEINRLSSVSYNKDDNHNYYRPRISIQELMATSDNIIITTACLASFLVYKDTEWHDIFLEWMSKNKHRCFLEIQYHTFEQQIEHNLYLYEKSLKHGIPLIAGTDTHALDKAKLELRTVLQHAKGIKYSYEDECDLTFKSCEELIKMFEKQNCLPMDAVLEAIDNTNVLADMVEDFDLDTSHKYPKIYANAEQEFRGRINHGIVKRGVDKYEPKKRKIYYDRLMEEFEVIKNMNAIDYFLLLDDIIRYCKENNIGTSPRGSCNGSLLLWVLENTDIDSIKYGLPFFRFLNPERVSLADVDIDMSGKRRDEVKDFLYNYPNIKGCAILTFSTYGLRGAVRDVGRGLEIPLSVVDEIAKDIDEIEEENELTGEVKRKTTFHNRDKWKKQYPKLIELAEMAIGTVYAIGVHPCGFVVSDREIDEEIGLLRNENSKWVVSQNNMKAIDAANFVKMDLLVVDNVQMVEDVCELAGVEKLKNDDIDFEDENVWSEMDKSGLGIFQFEKTGWFYLREMLGNYPKFKEVAPLATRLDLMTALNGIIRPAGDSIRDYFVKGVPKDNGMEELNEFLGKTLSYLIYQESIMMFLHHFCGYNMAQSDYVRRCVDKDTLVLMSNGDYKKISEIKEGEAVISYTEDGISQPQKVLSIFDNGIQKTYKIKTIHDYELIATGEHEILTQDGYKKLVDIAIGDTLMTPRKITSTFEDKRSSERLTQKEMYLIGILIGDGTLGKYDPDGYERKPSFTNSEVELIDAFKDCVNSRTRNGEYAFTVYEQNGKTVDKIYNVSVADKKGNRALANLLDKYDLRHTAATKKIPSEIMLYPASEKILYLLAGLFNTDGGCYINYIDYSTTSRILALQIKSLLLKFGIYTYIGKSFVRDYNYYCYKVRIQQNDSLKKFGELILPLIIGRKSVSFGGVISNTLKNKQTYNYLLPKKYKDEIIDSSISRGISLCSVGRLIDNGNTSDLVIHKYEKGITDIKARNIIQHLYAPETYKILQAEYLPVEVKEIVEIGERHVYDIEVENNHNYVAEGIIVHNCIAKKGGTEQLIPEIKEKFINYCTEHFPQYTEEHLSKVADEILQVIKDASDYGFSENHSCPYSILGFKGAYLRHYYPLEFLTTQLRINDGKMDKTTKIMEFINNFTDIRILPIKFRKSRADYFMSKEDNAIYKGIHSIKWMNAQLAEDLYELRDNQYDTFIDLLIDIERKVKIDSRQMNVLLRLNYFEEFGTPSKLLAIYGEFKNGTNRYKESHKDNTKQKRVAALYEFEKIAEGTPISSYEQIIFEKENLGYIDSQFKNIDKSLGVVLALDSKYTPKYAVYMLKAGREITYKVSVNDLNKHEDGMKVGDLIEIQAGQHKPRQKLINGDWVKQKETDPWITQWRVVERKEEKA